MRTVVKNCHMCLEAIAKESFMFGRDCNKSLIPLVLFLNCRKAELNLKCRVI